MSVQTPRRGSGAPGWTAASSPNSNKVGIDPLKADADSLADHIATDVSRAQVYTRDTKREHTNGFGTKHLFCLCSSSVEPQSFSDDVLV